MTGSAPDIAPEVAPEIAPIWFLRLYPQVLIGMGLGIALGLVRPEWGAAMQGLGEGFVKLVKMIIAPVIFLTIATGLGGLGQAGLTQNGAPRAGRVALRAFGYFLVVSTLALVVGLVVGNLVQPGAGLGVDPASLDSAAVAKYAAKAQ